MNESQMKMIDMLMQGFSSPTLWSLAHEGGSCKNAPLSPGSFFCVSLKNKKRSRARGCKFTHHYIIAYYIGPTVCLGHRPALWTAGGGCWSIHSPQTPLAVRRSSHSRPVALDHRGLRAAHDWTAGIPWQPCSSDQWEWLVKKSVVIGPRIEACPRARLSKAWVRIPLLAPCTVV